jgi:mRNA interferase RelE/StbE
MSFSIELSKEAASDLEGLFKADRVVFGRVLAKGESLADDPLQGKALVGNHKGEHSLRVGRYRIVYELDRQKRIVFVLTARHRKHSY